MVSMMERTGTAMPRMGTSTMGMPGMTSPSAMPTGFNFLMVPRCTIKLEKFTGGMKINCSADDKMAACMAHELREHNVAAVSLYPGLVRTEAVMKAEKFFDLSNSESPQYLGRTVAALAADENIMTRSGQWLIAAELADEYGFTDIDGKRPKSIRSEIPVA